MTRIQLRACAVVIAIAVALAAGASAAQRDGFSFASPQALSPSSPEELPVVVVIAMTGDISSLAQLFVAVPEATRVATLRGEQVTAGASRDGEDARVKLVSRIEAATNLPEVAGVVITQDAAAIDDTAAYLNRAIKTAKPVVLTVALSEEGKKNFHNAVAAAAHKGPAARGVVIIR